MFKNLNRYCHTIFIVFILLHTGSILAEVNQELTATTQIHHVLINDKGKETLLEIPFVSLNNILQYTITYTNNSRRKITNIQVTFRIPDNMTLVPNTIRPLPSHARRDSGDNWSPYPLTEVVASRNLPAGATQYKELAWTIPVIEPGTTSVIVVRAKLTQTPTTSIGDLRHNRM